MTDPKPAPAKPTTHPYGTTLEVVSKDNFPVTNPRGNDFTFLAADGVGHVVLDAKGTWTINGESVEVI